ncbi:MAG: hypothetical protein EXR27_18955 [Betaproteobacteria bacterium]|nr:hypothetical protein [Betaproteobacteria bacterium]
MDCLASGLGFRIVSSLCALLLAGQSLAFAERIALQSRSETAAGVKEAIVPVTLLLPGNAGPGVSLLIVINSSSGADDAVMQALVRRSVASGIGAVALNTYSARGISDTVTNQERVSYEEQFADLQSLLTVLREDRRFSKSKIALAGHSRGGILAYMAAFSEFQGYMHQPRLRLDAYVALSPSCQPTFRSDKLNGPLLIISGEKDDWTLPSPCERRIAQLQRAGEDAAMHIMAGANHSFSTSGGVHVSGAIKFPCPVENDYYYATREVTGQSSQIEAEQGEKFSPRQLWRKCAGVFGWRGRGASAGGNREKLDEVVERTVGFLRGRGW